MIKNISPFFTTKIIFLPKDDKYFTIELINRFSGQNYIFLYTQLNSSEEEMKLRELTKMLEV